MLLLTSLREILKNYKSHDINLRNRNVQSQYLGISPRFAVEGIGVNFRF